MKLPLYQRVCNDLIDQIRTGTLAPGVRLPGDQELEARYNTSRITIQRALQELQQGGFLRRVRGHGSFVLAAEGARPESRSGSGAQPIRFTAVVFPQGENYGAHSILLGIEQAFSDGTYMVGIKNSSDSARNERLIMESLLAQRPAGVVLFPALDSHRNTDLISRFLAQNIPLVLIDRKSTYIDTPFVACDNRDGARTLTDYLITQGRRRIAFVCSSLDHISSEQERFAGYCQSLTRAGLAVDMDLVIPLGHLDEERLGSALGRVKADAVFAVNDLWAIAVSRQLRSAGVRVPDQVAVVGFDDIEFSRFARPAITTYRQPFHEIGVQAAGVLREIIEGTRSQSDPVDIRVKGTLVVRESA